mmetsp:Transcript_21958/g.86125  ORF Transcript_21958/g.86125 Transcript_21958/m.86125 type:complete len:369 (-) Transcript_21958:4452-5558(-)
MQAPSQARTWPGSQAAASQSSATVCSSTPAARPRQPACAPATPPGAANSTGRQSATRMATASSGSVDTAASAWGALSSCQSGRSRTTVAPCTWSRKIGRAPSRAARSDRWARTCSGSPALRPKLGPRVVMKAATPGQSGRSQSGSGGIGTDAGVGVGKGRQAQAMLVDAHYRREVVQRAVEALGVVDLGHEQAVGQARCVAEAEAARGRGQTLLDDGQAGGDPMVVPAVHLLLRMAEVVLQIAQHAQIVQRMDVTADVLGQRPHLGPGDRILRQQRRLGLHLVQILEDSHGLAQPAAVIQHQGRHQMGHLLVRKGLGELLVAGQMDGRIVIVHALEREADAHPPGCRRAEVVVELHVNALRAARASRL